MDRALLPFAPLLYVAWADGQLSSAEATAIRARLDDAALSDDVRARLQPWLDETHPPDAAALQSLLDAIRFEGARLSGDMPRSLAELGRQLAHTAGTAADASTERAVRALDEALGLSGDEAVRAVLGPTLDSPAAAVTAPLSAHDSAAIGDFLLGKHAGTERELLALLATDEFAHVPLDISTPDYRARVLDWTRALAARGYGALPYPREFGGEHDMDRSLAAYRAVACHDLSLFTKYGVQFGLFAGSIYQLGTRRHHAELLPRALTLELPGCFAMTETGHGSNVRDLETTATYDRATREFVVHTPRAEARKDYIGNAAAHGRVATVFAQLHTPGGAHGVHAFVVPIRDEQGAALPGVRIEDCGAKAGLNGVDNGRLYFDQVRIPRENLLDRFGSVDAAGVYTSPIASAGRRFFTMLGTLVGGRLAVAGAASSAARVGLTIAIRYADTRTQFGPEGAPEVPLLDYRAVQRRLLPALAASFAVEIALRKLAADYAVPDPASQLAIEGRAAGLKAFASDHAVQTLQACREVCGGQGYMAVNRIAQLRADSDVFTTFEGANAVLLQLVAKGLLTGYREQFGEIKLWGVVRLLARGAATAVTERNPIATRRADSEHLRSPEYLRNALEYREQRLLGSLARRLKRRIDDGMDSFAALNDVQDHALHLAQAHTERTLYTDFADALAAAPDGVRAALAPLAALFGLDRIAADRGWYLEAGYLEAGKARAVRAEVNRLCTELRPVAPGLVDAFGLPEAVVDAPIASSANGIVAAG